MLLRLLSDKAFASARRAFSRVRRVSIRFVHTISLRVRCVFSRLPAADVRVMFWRLTRQIVLETGGNTLPSSTPFWPLFVLAIAAPVAAQEVPAVPVAPPASLVAPTIAAEPEITVDELVRRALANSPQLPIARQNQEVARQRLAALRAFQNPTLELVPRIIGNREAADSEVLVSQPLDLFGRRRAQAGVAAAELRRAQSESTLAERTLVVAVKNAAADLFAAQEAESLGQVQVEVAQLFRDAAARRAELGDVAPVQVQRADLELLRVQNDLTNAQTERLSRRAALNLLVGQAPEMPLRVAVPALSNLTDLLRLTPGPLRLGAATSGTLAATEAASGAPNVAAGAATDATNQAASATPALPSTAGALAASNAVAASGASGTGTQSTLGGSFLPGTIAQSGNDLTSLRGQILPDALTNRPDVVGAQATLEARQAQIKVLRRQRLPEIELQARRGAFFGQRGSYALRAVVTLPIFDFGSLKRERRALEAEAGAQQATIGLLRAQISTQVEQALLRLQQQRQTVERFRTGIVPLTLDLLRKTQIGYAAGASTYLEVLEAQRTLRQVQTEYLQALVGTRTQEAALESALGATPSAGVLAGIVNPMGAAAPPGVAAPGTVPEGTIPPATIAPLSPLGAPPTQSVPAAASSANSIGTRSP